MQTQRKFNIQVSGFNAPKQQSNRYGMSGNTENYTEGYSSTGYMDAYYDRGYPTGPAPVSKTCGCDMAVSVAPYNPPKPTCGQSYPGCACGGGQVGPVQLMTCSRFSGAPLGPDYAANPYAFQQGPWAPYF